MTVKKTETVEEFRQKLEQMRDRRVNFRKYEERSKKNVYQSSMTMRRRKEGSRRHVWQTVPKTIR